MKVFEMQSRSIVRMSDHKTRFKGQQRGGAAPFAESRPFFSRAIENINKSGIISQV
jgi:hypothetical protein